MLTIKFFHVRFNIIQILSISRDALTKAKKRKKIIIIQYNLDATSGDLVPCAQHICKELVSEHRTGNNVFVFFVLQLSREATSIVDYKSLWECVHIDEVRNSKFSSLIQCIGKPISSLFDNSTEWLHVVTGAVQSAMTKVNQIKCMSTDDITNRIKILQELLRKGDGN